jgi:hypothetical protein
MISSSYGNFFVALEGFLWWGRWPSACRYLIVESHASCVLSGAFWEQRKKEKENQQDAVFLKKVAFFSILISEFQFLVVLVDFNISTMVIVIHECGKWPNLYRRVT